MIQSKNSYKKKFFEDRAGIATKSGLIYDIIKGRYTTDVPLGSTVTTSATQRIGQVSTIRETYTDKDLENLGYPTGAINVGSVTVFTGSVSEQSALDMIDFYRSGKNITNIKQFARATTTVPLIRVSPNDFFDDDTIGTIDHTINFNAYGQGYLFLDVDESAVNQKIIPYNDFGEIDPADYVKNQTVGFPFIHNTIKNYSQFVDPSDTGINGAIDVFEVRKSITNLSISDISVLGIKGDFQAGGIESLRKGSSEIMNRIYYKINSNSSEAFEDSQDILFPKFSFQKKGLVGIDGQFEDRKFELPGTVGTKKYKMLAYKDETIIDKLSNSYRFLNGEQKSDLLLKSDKSRSAEGESFKLTTNGLIFGESNPLGTDSIAFGGLKK